MWEIGLEHDRDFADGVDEVLEVAASGLEPERGRPPLRRTVAGLIAMPSFDEIRIVFDATSVKAHIADA